MKPFDLEKALAGELVQLRDGRKAIILCRIPDTFTYEDGTKVSFPLLGISLEDDGTVNDQFASWRDDGRFASTDSASDIMGMYEEPKFTTAELMEKAFQEKLVVIRTKLPLCGGFEVVGKTLDGDYILQNCDNAELRFLQEFNKDIEWAIEG